MEFTKCTFIHMLDASHTQKFKPKGLDSFMHIKYSLCFLGMKFNTHMRTYNKIWMLEDP